WREILGVLSKYGLANWISLLDIEFAKEFFKDADGESLARLTTESRIRLALSELGPTFIKLGQVLSTRPDLIGVELAAELTQLQTDVRADPPATVRETIERELGRPLGDAYAEFNDEPLASASIGQVHAARLHTGQRVVVKVQHAGIEEKVRVDLEILVGLATLAEKLPELVNYRPRATVEDFQRILRRELDFTRESRHMEHFATVFAGDERVVVPRAIAELSTERVITMERIDGIKLCEREQLASAGCDLVEIARRGAELYVKMIFDQGEYHADPHPGNFVILPGNVIGLLDWGMVGRIDESLREEIEEMFLAIAQRDGDQLTRIIMRVGAVPQDLDEAALELDVTDFVSHYTTQPIEELNVGAALNEMIEMIRRFRIMLPARIAMLLRVLVMLEGTSRLISPKFSLMDVILPYQKKMAWRRMSPQRHWRKLRRISGEVERLLEALPRSLIDLLQQVQTGRFDVHLDHRGLEPSVNRLVLGLLTSSLFLGSTQLLSYNVPPLLPVPWIGNLSLLGLAGGTVSLMLGLRLLRAINKSGHLDRHK
ncbi:MAG: AarF/ABC1/UbiB kinase family protein, partial [Planctomycetaceae bacterium]|nr:AarF/ABC1/UbiB kinase family protein [Planctomycetaceae bacterium]